MDEHNDSLRAAEYVLGLLDDAQAAEFEQRLKKEPELRSDFLNWSEHFATLYQDVEDIEPPPSLKARIQHRLFAEIKRETRQAKPKSALWSWPALWIGCLLLAIALGFMFYQAQQPTFQPDYLASLATEDESLQVLASYDKTHNVLQVQTIKAPAVDGRSHELWLIAANSPPVSLGILQAINNENIILPEALSSVIIGATLAISDEPEGGSPISSPTGKVLTTATVTDR